MYPMLPVYLDCPYLIAPLVFCNMYCTTLLICHSARSEKAYWRSHARDHMLPSNENDALRTVIALSKKVIIRIYHIKYS